jgi:RHS repeat-associated protein
MITDLTYNLNTIESQWDGSGNMTMQQLNTDNGVLERALCWDEENRLTTTRDDIYLTNNIYDASGTRVWKLAAEANYMWSNGNLYASGDLNLRTLYQSEYTTITDVGYTKHYYIEGQRIASKLGGGFSGMGETEMGGDESTISTNLEPLDREIDALGERFWNKMMRDFTCVGINGENLNMDQQLPAIENLIKRDDTEHDLYFYHGDHLGSSSYNTDINGDATQHLEYLPFGEDFIHEQNATSYYTPYTFSAKERDMETQYSYFGARYYDAGLSIWLSVDPMSDKYPSISAYNYCMWNPVMLVDPDGRDIETDENTYKIIEKGLVAILGSKNPFSLDGSKMKVGEYNREDFNDTQLEVIDKFSALIEDKTVVTVKSVGQNEPIAENDGNSLFQVGDGAAGITIPYSANNEIVKQSVYIAVDPQRRETENGQTTITREKSWYSALTAIHEIAGHAFENRFNRSSGAEQRNRNVESFENRFRQIFMNNGTPIKGTATKH